MFIEIIDYDCCCDEFLPIIINVDMIERIFPAESEDGKYNTIIFTKIRSLDGRKLVYHSKETYQEIKEKLKRLKCQS